MKSQDTNKKLPLALLLFVMLSLTPAAMAAQITTDQEDYAPWEIVTITGSGFEPYAPITLTIEWPDGYLDEFYGAFDADGAFIWTSPTCPPDYYFGTADDSGGFTLVYGKEKYEGTYIVTATDGTSTATTTFTDTVNVHSVTSSDSGGTTKTSFLTTEDVYAHIDITGGGATTTFRIYVVTSVPAGHNGTALVDVSGGYETGTTGSTTFEAWHHNTTAGTYYIITDEDQDGTYSGSDHASAAFTIAADTTPPTAGTVNDGLGADIDSQSSTTEISANWTGFSDAESGIAGYEWAIGTTSGGTDVQGFTSVGTATNATNSSLSLTDGDTYYVTVRATNGEGLQTTATSDGVTVNVPPVETADVTFDQSGVGGDFLGVVVTIDGTDYGVLDLPVIITKAVDDTISFEYYSPLIVDGTQYVWTSTSGLSAVQSDATMAVPSGGGSVTGNYGTQYYLTVTSPYGLPTSGEGWYDAGDPAYAGLTSDVEPGGPGIQYVFHEWTNDASGTNYLQSDAITMDAPKEAIADWTTQYYLTLVTDPLGITTPTGEGWYDDGEPANISTDENVDIVAGQSRYHFTDWSTADMGEIANPLATSTTVTMDQPKTVTANYVTQYYLTVDSDPAAVGTQTGEGWYDAEDDAPITTDPNVDIVAGESRYHFTGWTTGDMTEIDDSTAASTTVYMDKAKTVTANYVVQYRVTFDQTGLDGTATGTVATYEVDALGPTTLEFPDFPEGLWVDEGTEVTYNYEFLVASSTPGYQFWLASVTGPASPVTVNSAVTITGNYRELPKSALTSGGCPFDKDEGLDGQQFRLIFTQDPTNISTYKVTASNPGQFFYNVFYVGQPGSDVDLDLTIPYPFVTQGATPIHFYSGVDVVDGCYMPLDEIGGFGVAGTGTVTPNGSLGIALDDYTDGTVTLTVTGTVPDSGLAYLIIHLDYGLKKDVGYNKDASNNAEKPIGTDVILDLTDYVFAVGGAMTDAQTIENENVFKHDPGFAGLVINAGTFDPMEGAVVRIYNSAGSLLATITTDGDGFYFFSYKHKGKTATYTVSLPASGQSQVITVKPNGLVNVDFTVAVP